MFDTASLVTVSGYLGIAAVIFAESGLLIGIILPGDSLLFTAGVLTSQGIIHIIPLMVVAFIAAVAGDSFGYWLGERFGPRVFSRENSFFLNKKHIARAERFFTRHGAKTLILARFTPIVRTLTPVLAGVGRMRYRTFLLYNIIGGALWGFSLPLAGYWLGNAIPGIDQYLLPVLLVIIVVSLAPGLYHFLRERDNRRLVGRTFKNLFS